MAVQYPAFTAKIINFLLAVLGLTGVVMKTRILVVDDERDFTHMLKLQLERFGYFEVLEENDETLAVATAREFGPDLVLLDLMMPNREGTEVAAAMHSDALLRDTPILFLTALVAEADAPGGGSYCSGGRTFLPKSLPTASLIECIRKTLRERRAVAV